MKIQKLPDEVSSKLQSSITVTDAAQCVLELVYNSLDAEATGIAVKIDFKTYQIVVIDNGKGIGREDLELVGERFMTTKFQAFVDMETSVSTYGFKGQTLSSLRTLSRSLRIETKPEKNGATYVKTFQNNKALPITTLESEKTGTGTSVFIDDFMYTMPVRRKRINEVFDIEEIKNHLQYLAIIHFRVCFTLRNESKSLIILQTPQASNILESLTNIYGKTFVRCLKALYYQEEKYEISGYLSLKPKNPNNVQLIYVNKRIITKGVMHKFINNLIKENSEKEILFSNSPTSKILKSLKSTCNAFIIEIKCPRYYYELFTNARKTKVEFKNLKAVLKCIHKALRIVYKDIMNFESSSKSQDCDGSKAKTYTSKKTFGTSFLINAVKGPPVKRELENKKDSQKKKKIKKSDNGYLPKSNENKTLNIHTKNISKECANDSLESPIPKKSFRHKMFLLQSKKTKSYNQSFVEFYEWLKAKSKTDTNALNFYNDFLQNKNKSCNSKEVTECKSPVFRGKPKRKQIHSPKKITEKAADDFSAVDEQKAIISQRRLKHFPSTHSRLKKAVEFASEMKCDLPDFSGFEVFKGENFRFKDSRSHSALKKSDGLLVLDGGQKNQIIHNYSFSSLPSSEAQFVNLIRFRNLSESFFRQTSEPRLFPEKTIASSTSNTWASHYRNFEFNDVKINKKKRNLENCFSSLESNVMNKNFNYADFYNLSKVDLFELGNELKRTVALQNVEIQVNMSEIVFPVNKINAVVQTSEVPKYHSFEDSYAFNQEHEMQAEQYGQFGYQVDKNPYSLEKINVEEPSNLDILISSCQISMNRTNTPNFYSTLKDNEKNSTSNEFICGHKSVSSFKNKKERSTSKETQTLADIRTDNLSKMEDPIVCDAAINSKLTDSNSETIPVKQIECNFLQTIESEFCLTERHDCVPKGLSPLFLNQDAAKIRTLSPREKNKIQLTIDSTQNEFLTSIKWQDELTGEYLKPLIPDEILFEMCRKSGESASNYENPVLSASLSYCAVKIHNLLHSFAFTKELLSTVEIIGQLDKKFIVTKMKIFAPKKMELISLFDQHAVDERIKLEELITENILANGKFSSTSLDPPLHCVLTESDVRVVLDLKETILNFGLHVELVNETTVCVKEITTFLFNKHEKDLRNKKECSLTFTVKAVIMNIVKEIRETRGAIPKIPKIIHNAFCVEACHKAIKFNKALTVENMTDLINKLQNCNLPFQCAHGRPSVIPVIDLEDFKLKMEESEISFDSQDIKKFLK